MKISLSVLGYEVAVLVLEFVSEVDNTLAAVSEKVTILDKGIKKMSRAWTQRMVK